MLTVINLFRRGNNYLSRNPYEVHFGLGEATEADVTVIWFNVSRPAA